MASSGRIEGRRGARKLSPSRSQLVQRNEIELQPLAQQQQRQQRQQGRRRSLGQRHKTCVICVGTTGAGKSATISRFTGRRAPSSAGFERQTQECGLYEDQDPNNPVWIDTVGWEDSSYDDVLSFQDILQFLRANKITMISAIVWNIIPNVRMDQVLMRQAKLINMFCPGLIWPRVIIVCKGSMNPAQDGAGALKAAEKFHLHPDTGPQVLGYRFISDLPPHQRSRFEFDEETKTAFNVVTDEDVRMRLHEALGKLRGEGILLRFKEVQCKDCGAIDDPRLMPVYCHYQRQLVHVGKVAVVHPEPIEHYHEIERQIAEHDAPLVYPWYGSCMKSMVTPRYACCGRRAGKIGCTVKWQCCRQPPEDPGCLQRYGCCGEPPSSSTKGCEPRFLCCNGVTDGPGCVAVCRKCGQAWGSSAVDTQCFRKESHNTVDYVKEPAKPKVVETKPSAEIIDTSGHLEPSKVKMFLGIPPLVLPKAF